MEFKGKYWFLSTMSQYPFDYEINGKMYRFQCADAAFYACKCPERAGEFEGLQGRAAKDLGKTLKKKEIDPNFESNKLDILKNILRAKFENPVLAMQLASIDGPITFDNNYHDIYWGLYHGRGQNKLGKLLMDVRDEVKVRLGIHTEKNPDVVTYKIQKGGIVAFDTETTGLSSKYDDILQITIAGQDGSILLSTYVKPQNCTEWPEAMAVHHITPEMVADAPSADKVADIVKKIFDEADLIVGYNVGFDVKMTAARFGYDFESKELKAREKNKDKWEEVLGNVVKELSFIKNELLNMPEDRKRKHPVSLENNLLYDRLKKDKISLLDEKFNNFDELVSLGSKYTPSLTVCDVLPIYRQYTKDAFAGEVMPHKLVNACEHLCPEYFEEFKDMAHDAAADTLATIEVAKALCEVFPGYFNEIGIDPKEILLEKNRWGENKLFGIDSGIVCHQVNCKGVVPKGFTSRLFRQYPALKTDFYETYDKFEENSKALFGKVRLFSIQECEDLKIASIYAQEKNGDALKTGIVYTDADVLVNCVKRLCETFPDKPVYLPCIMSAEYGPFEITDGIGCGKSGEQWSKLEAMFNALDMKNLYYLDTQTGRIEAGRGREKGIRDELLENEDLEIG